MVLREELKEIDLRPVPLIDIHVFMLIVLLKPLSFQFDLVCDKGTFIANSQTSFNAGTALGAALTAPISDRFGRKTLWFICVLLTHVFGAFMAAMFDYWTFCFCQFLTGFFIQVSL